MIKGKAKLEFGTGTIAMTPCLREDGVAALCLRSAEKHDIDSHDALPDDWTPAESQVIMTFTNMSSVKALIMDLAEIMRYFRHPEQITAEYWGREIEMDFDSFMEDSNE